MSLRDHLEDFRYAVSFRLEDWRGWFAYKRQKLSAAWGSAGENLTGRFHRAVHRQQIASDFKTEFKQRRAALVCDLKRLRNPEDYEAEQLFSALERLYHFYFWTRYEDPRELDIFLEQAQKEAKVLASFDLEERGDRETRYYPYRAGLFLDQRVLLGTSRPAREEIFSLVRDIADLGDVDASLVYLGMLYKSEMDGLVDEAMLSDGEDFILGFHGVRWDHWKPEEQTVFLRGLHRLAGTYGARASFHFLVMATRDGVTAPSYTGPQEWREKAAQVIFDLRDRRASDLAECDLLDQLFAARGARWRDFERWGFRTAEALQRDRSASASPA